MAIFRDARRWVGQDRQYKPNAPASQTAALAMNAGLGYPGDLLPMLEGQGAD